MVIDYNDWQDLQEEIRSLRTKLKLVSSHLHHCYYHHGMSEDVKAEFKRLVLDPLNEKDESPNASLTSEGEKK